ncbi:vomeronasal type-2 receptor 26-like [Leptodactylus fuscus]|uniref:vomeronasal type-2 receptor 26-like n=1 Tax=Leptodactylus fuscus TaxID=238119 RepID=UPI003F4ED7E7
MAIENNECNTDVRCELPNGDNDSPLSYSRDGDVIIGGILQIFLAYSENTVDFLFRPSADTCMGTSYEYLKHHLAFIYAIEEINNRTDILPNITLGFQIYDSCTSENLAVQSVLNIISHSQEPIPNYICQKSQKMVAVVGHLLATSTYTIARLTQLYGYPQFDAIVELLIHFGWTWVGIIGTQNDRSQQATMELKKQMEKCGICVDFMAFISIDESNYQEKASETVEQIKKSSVSVIIFYGLEIPFVGFLQSFTSNISGKLNYYLKEVKIKGPSGADIFFNNKGYVEGNFDVLNVVVSSDMKISNVLVGYWLSTSNKLEINESAIVWNPYFIELGMDFQTPRSVCTDPCSPGYRQSLDTGKRSCCFECVPCNDGEITNGTAKESCQTCPDDEWSNPSRDKCIKHPLHFLSYEEDLGISLAIIATIFFGMTSSVLWIFVKYRNTPLVRANNCNLSYVLLVSLMICFLLSFLFIGHPEELTCLMRQTTFGFVFAVAISSVLGKTTTVLIAFNATKPGSKLRKCVGSQISTGLVIMCSLGEFIICVTWLISAPPVVELDSKTIPGTMIVQCNEGSIIAFYVVVSYIGILAIFSFIIAFISRKLPDTFNEAQYITFSMLVFCSVWISFIPTYVCTKGKYMVAVEIFAILASNGALLCFIFFPKCYIILFKPESNKKGEISIKVYEM